MSYVLGIDLGTGSLKGLLFNESGELITTADQNYALLQPKPGYSEQNPLDWKEAMFNVMDELNNRVDDFSERLVAISFSGQMHSLVLLDQHNEVIRPAILWNDVRTTKQCQTIMEEFGPELLAITKNIALEGFTLPKILWIQENELENWQKTKHLMLPKDYLVYSLTGEYSMDYSDAAGTLLLDIEKLDWSEDILTQFNINRSILPTLHRSIDKVASITTDIKERYGFTHDVSVHAGGADNACAALGAGIVDKGLGMISIGTSGVFLASEPTAEVDYKGKVHLFNHSAPDLYYAMGVTLAAGNSLNWFKNTFASNLKFEELLEGIDKIEPGSEGLLFTPYITGERTPHNDSEIRGSFTNIDIRHGLKHFARAVLEGITFSLKDAQMIMSNVSNQEFDRLVSVGGGAKNKDWLQMQADIFNAEIITLETEQGPGVGAAMLAAIGSGVVDSVEDCISKFVKYDKSYQPNADNVAKYQEVYERYQKVYPAIKQI
ncbi:xylulokinase [Globicatella sulfidifaciens]|uniref:Xylulose kinase n=1 Tax=Globicatella sulfidifaciens TaxID=136093 RepID=A0A7X8C3M5_9LACT|nr:xylulokinase [Globicatella sulfidifaciens]NLJ18340.1 xylulokinase [Globicatella sulfidifaciens]